MPSPDPNFAELWLHWVTGGEPAAFSRLVGHFGDPGSVMANRRERALELPDGISRRMRGEDEAVEQGYVELALRWLEGPGHHIVTVSSEHYPGRLREISDPPPVMFAAGDVSLLATTQLAIVGTRRATATGRRVAVELSRDSAQAGLTITSGMAAGIDAAAHTGALEAGGPTIAVLGTGCDIIYPPRNVALAREIVDQGLLISEFPLGTKAFPANFPRRNRVVTGMSVGTLVIEAALRSGSLISARLAMEQGREVFAVPGSVLSPQSRGCHFLIRDGAKLTESIDDIAEELSLIVCRAQAGRPQASLSPAKGRIVDALAGGGADIDTLAGVTGDDVPSLMASLIELEIDGIIMRSGGSYFLVEGRA